MITRQYKLINNAGGWFVFIIALLTYWLTLEPTASYWDCGEFIIQADKLEIGHPPGNPIFMLTARFFANFASSAQTVSVMVNAMSGLFSALTILLLFWTITHLVRRLVVKDDRHGELSLQKYLVIMGSGLVGSLAYCWSDTFWFSAVEGEVYAFSSFCTALVFWLILKWENRADKPHSDRYLILIAYIIGVSVAVHLLNLLCIPAIVLVFVYRKWKDVNLVGSLVALLVSFVMIALVLFGLVPGFIKAAQVTELVFVNGFHLGFNSGALAYIILMIISILWALHELRRQKNATLIRLSFVIAVTLSGMLFMGSGITIGIVLTLALIALLWLGFKRNLPVRVLSVIMYSIGAIFIGYSSYALIIIRSSANTPMNQNAPDNVFDLASYLNREQYGQTPLIYGETLFSSTQYNVDGYPRIEKGAPVYAKGVQGVEPVSSYDMLSEKDKAKNRERANTKGDYYVVSDYKADPVLNPELNMFFPRLYSGPHANSYKNWVNIDYNDPSQMVDLSFYDPQSGKNVSPYMAGYAYDALEPKFKPSFAQNLAYFFNYQLNHMYMRYFLWNFVGRQNDVNNQHGELDAGNWISGIPVIDNARLGDQSLLPDDLGKDNAGNNKYYFLPLLLGIIGLVWQSFAGRRGIEQFWIVFFLFFMTGIAIVLYLNQTPDQPRERDYAFAGSFYAFAIWIGMGVAGLWRLLKPVGKPFVSSVIAVALGLCVPLQMVSQTWDDHDRSGRYAARDFAVNYLESLEPNAIVFCNGDNDTFPLWYVQEVEGVRPDVKIINLSYLNSVWYANQHRIPSYEAAPVSYTVKPEELAYNRLEIARVPFNKNLDYEADLLQSLKALYAEAGTTTAGYPTLKSTVMTIPVDKSLMVKRGLVEPQDTSRLVDKIRIDLGAVPEISRKGYLTLGEILMLDIIATNAAEGWPRPIYWASTVGDSYHVGLTPYMRSTGMTYQLVPTIQEDKATRTDRAYDNITKKYRWGIGEGATPYFDETARRMLYGMRMSMLDLADMLLTEGDSLAESGNAKKASEAYAKALEVVKLLEAKLPERVNRYDLGVGMLMAKIYCEAGNKLNDPQASERGREILANLLERNAKSLKYYNNVVTEFSYYGPDNKVVRPSLTYETQYIPYIYANLVEDYIKYAGQGNDSKTKAAEATVDKVLEGTGFTRADLKKFSEAMTSGQQDEMQSGEYSMEDLTLEVIQCCEIANYLSTLSPEEYAATSAMERDVDSILESYISVYLELGGSEQELSKYAEYKKLDRNRSKRLHEEYLSNHQ